MNKLVLDKTDGGRSYVRNYIDVYYNEKEYVS